MDIRALVVLSRHVDTLMARRFCEAAFVPWEPAEERKRARHKGHRHRESRELRECREQRLGALDRAGR